MNTNTRSVGTTGIALVITLLAGVGLLLAHRATTYAATPAHQAAIVITILPGGHLDSGQARRDIDLSTLAGRHVRVSFQNFDPAVHMFAIPGLSVTATIAASPRRGVPAVTTFGFQPRRAGLYRWWYVRACGRGTAEAAHDDGHLTGMFTVAAA